MFGYGDLHDLLSSRGGGWDSGKLINIGVKGAIGWDHWLIVHIVVFLFFSSACFCAGGRLGHGSGSGHSWHTCRHTTGRSVTCRGHVVSHDPSGRRREKKRKCVWVCVGMEYVCGVTCLQ